MSSALLRRITSSYLVCLALFDCFLLTLRSTLLCPSTTKGLPPACFSQTNPTLTTISGLELSSLCFEWLPKSAKVVLRTRHYYCTEPRGTLRELIKEPRRDARREARLRGTQLTLSHAHTRLHTPTRGVRCLRAACSLYLAGIISASIAHSNHVSLAHITLLTLHRFV